MVGFIKTEGKALRALRSKDQGWALLLLLRQVQGALVAVDQAESAHPGALSSIMISRFARNGKK